MSNVKLLHTLTNIHYQIELISLIKHMKSKRVKSMLL